MPPPWPSDASDPGHRVGFWALLAIACVAALLTFKPSGAIEGVVIGVLGAAIFETLRPLARIWRDVPLAVAANVPGRRRAVVRVSISYLYRVRLNDKYLLVEGVRVPGLLQPVGGVFKRLADAGPALTKLGVHDDDKLPIDESSKDDLRVRVEGRNLLAFLRWYDSGEGREVETWREFYEELVRPGIVSQTCFPHIVVRHLRQHRTRLEWSEHFQCWQMRVAEIVEPVPTPEQQVELEGLASRETDGIAWVTEELIRSRGFDHAAQQTRHPISETSTWIL